MLAAPIASVFASGKGILPQVGNVKNVAETSSTTNIADIKSAEDNRATQRNCGYSTFEGMAGGLFKGIEKATSMKWENVAELKYCPDSDYSKEVKAMGGFGSTSSVLGILNTVNGTVVAQRPSSGVQYVEEKVYAITNPGVVYAQDPASYYPGTGFDLLQPVRNFWGWSVNFVFGFLIVIIIIIAFAIIFRQRLPGNVEVTIQTAIPNIALAMILVPLSYAISGLFIDAITIGSNVVHDFIVGPQSPGNQVYVDRGDENIPNGSDKDRGLYIDDERVNWINARSEADYRQEAEAFASNLDNSPLAVIGGLLNILDENAINNTSLTPGATSAWIGTIVNAILSVIMIYIGIRIFIRLFQKYLALILMPIISPFIFATVAVPGNGTKAIVSYAKSLGAASLGFIVAYAMFLLTIVFSSSAFQATVPDFNTGLWVPPLLSLHSGITEGTAGVGSGIGLVPFIFGLVSLGIYFSIPKVLDQIDDALDAKFTIPQFVRTPFESFREASRVTFRTAPALAGRGLLTGGRVGRDAVYSPFRATQTLQNLSDRARGFTPGEEGTALANRRRAIGKDIGRIQREIAAEKAKGAAADAGKIRRLQAEETAQRIKADAFGSGVGRPEGESEPELKASFSFAGSPVVNISLAEAEGMRRQRAIGNSVVIRGGKVSFEAVGFTLPANVAANMQVYQTIGRETEFGDEIDTNKTHVTGLKGVEPDPKKEVLPITTEPDNNRPFVFIRTPDSADSGAIIEARIDPGMNVNSSRDGKKWELPIILSVLDVAKFVGASATDAKAYLRPDNDVLSEKVIFKIGEYESDPVRITIPRIRN